jgi:hypothetical protein
MRNSVILGSGRSGTSMVAGALAKAGFFMGDNLLKAKNSNPKGFFEDREIIRVNEALLAQILPTRPPMLGRWFFRSWPITGHRWLAPLPLGTNVPCPENLARKMRDLAEREPFCFKDPRFAYTLPAWRPVLRDPIYICVFRDPATTVLSILKLLRDHIAKPQEHRITFEHALNTWSLTYRHILERHRREGAWLFVHYNQMFTKKGLARFEAFVDAPVDHSFPESSLRRSISDHAVSEETMQIYEQLCELAEYELDSHIAVKSETQFHGVVAS